MCGIIGFLSDGRGSMPVAAIEQLADSVAHRGPDARALFVDEAAGVALGHLRLAIVDPTETGSQPMTSPSGRFVMVLNGEIYNFKDIRRDLDLHGGRKWRGTSDTEVLLNAIETWGLARTLEISDGMFAFALWDRHSGELTLARDRFGEKPLIVARTAGGLAFASQLGGLMAMPGFSNESDDDAIEEFLAFSYIPEPRTPFRDAFKVPAGTYCTLRQGDGAIEPVTYWSASAAAVAAQRDKAVAPEQVAEVKSAIEARLRTVVGNQMLADVPLGAFLSGGIDSSLVVALMQEVSTRPVKTFTIGFEEEAYNEAGDARRIAAHLGTDHTEFTLSWNEALGLVDRLPDFYDEPFADSSQLPTYLVSRTARSAVTVALTGDAGDEVFGGYNRHAIAAKYGQWLERTPSFVKAGIGRALSGPAQSQTLENVLRSVGIGRNIRLLGEKAGKVAAMLRSSDRYALYQSLVRRDDGLMGDAVIARAFSKPHEEAAEARLDLPGYMMLMDTLTYLPGDILTKVDRASMAVALETRAPYLDHRLFELAWRLPSGEHIKNGRTKTVLREMLSKRVPDALMDRPKAGFGVPIAAWLRGPLKDWLVTHAGAFSRQNPQHAGRISRAMAALEAGSPSVHHFLWNVVMLQLWRDRHQPAGASTAARRAAAGTL